SERKAARRDSALSLSMFGRVRTCAQRLNTCGRRNGLIVRPNVDDHHLARQRGFCKAVADAARDLGGPQSGPLAECTEGWPERVRKPCVAQACPRISCGSGRAAARALTSTALDYVPPSGECWNPVPLPPPEAPWVHSAQVCPCPSMSENAPMQGWPV